jgi:transglutaminase-like putative cysteine protease
MADIVVAAIIIAAVLVVAQSAPTRVRTIEPLEDGRRGTLKTLERMRELVLKDATNLNTRRLALQIVQGCPGHDFRCEVEKLFEFVQQIPYRRDPVDVELVRSLKHVVRGKEADCDDKVVALATLLRSLGHRVRFVVGGSHPDNLTHVWLEVLLNNQWIPLDPTPEYFRPGDRGKFPYVERYLV